MNQRNRVVFLLGFFLIFFTSVASAHVTVWPKETKTGAYEKYTVRVPVEENSATTKIRLVFPVGVTVESVEPIPGWNYSFEKGSKGENTALVWTASNGGIKPNEFQEFSFVGKNPDDATSLSWKAIQTYQDGTVVQWIDGKDGKNPASVTVVSADPMIVGGQSSNHNHGASVAVAAAQQSPEDSYVDKGWTTGNIISLIFSAVALLLSIVLLFRRSITK